MNVTYILPSLLLLLIGNVNVQNYEVLMGSWTLQIENPQHKLVTTLKIHFAKDEAQSCLGGNWKKVVVDSHETTDPYFFPVSEPLSYELKGNRLFIGRNEICDAYLQLSGELINATVAGEYIAFGWGSKKLGYFSLKRGGKQ